jgi:undecaprenyl-diphosphatase
VRAVFIVAALILSVIIADQIASGIIKNVVGRMRPSHEVSLDGLVHIVNGRRGGSYGFVSSHAANMFAIATFTAMIFRNKLYGVLSLTWAAIIAYSRIYLGVHYPGDILGGTIVGVLTALFFVCLLMKLKFIDRNSLTEISNNKNIKSHKIRDLYIFYIVFFGTWTGFLIISN